MRRRIHPLIQIIALLNATPLALAAPAGWPSPLGPKHLACTPAAPCRITQKSGERFDAIFDLDVEPGRGLRSIRALRIRNVATGAEQKFSPESVARAPADEPFEFYAPDLRGDGDHDISLLSFTSPHAGPLYYYFLFDARHHSFRFANATDPIPAMIYRADRSAYVGADAPEIVYRDDPKRGLIPAEKTTKR